MATCARCGAGARPRAAYCPKCGHGLHTSGSGEPISRRPEPDYEQARSAAPVPWAPSAGQGYGWTEDDEARSPGPAAVRQTWSTGPVRALIVVVLVLLIGSATATWVIAGSDDPAPPLEPLPSSSAAPPEPTGSVDATAVLGARADTDRATADALVGRWLPQLSSKAEGMMVDGTRIGDPEILQNFRDLQARYPGAFLVRSSDYVSFRHRGLWVVLVGMPFDSGEATNAWCDGQGLGPDDCYAKRLTTTGGPAGNTVLRGVR